jgi:AraC-like DNA-binding protein
MQHQEFEPAQALRDTIKCFWYNKRDPAALTTGFEVVPDGYAEIIFYFGSVLSVSYNGSLQPLPSPFMMGLLNQPVLFESTNHLQIIGIRCFPWTVFDLLSLPSGNGELHILKHPIAALQPILNNCINTGQVNEAIALLQQYFLDAGLKAGSNTMLHKAGLAMSEANGTLPVNQVAAAAHATVRTLERKFKQSSGHTVKDVSALMRFEQVRNQLWLNPQRNIAGLAQEFGYTDQSHLSREFKRFSGTTPAAFARATKKRKQAAGNNFVAFVQD